MRGAGEALWIASGPEPGGTLHRSVATRATKARLIALRVVPPFPLKMLPPSRRPTPPEPTAPTFTRFHPSPRPRIGCDTMQRLAKAALLLSRTAGSSLAAPAASQATKVGDKGPSGPASGRLLGVCARVQDGRGVLPPPSPKVAPTPPGSRCPAGSAGRRGVGGGRRRMTALPHPSWASTPADSYRCRPSLGAP